MKEKKIMISGTLFNALYAYHNLEVRAPWVEEMISEGLQEKFLQQCKNSAYEDFRNAKTEHDRDLDLKVYLSFKDKLSNMRAAAENEEKAMEKSIRSENGYEL